MCDAATVGIASLVIGTASAVAQGAAQAQQAQAQQQYIEAQSAEYARVADLNNKAAIREYTEQSAAERVAQMQEQAQASQQAQDIQRDMLRKQGTMMASTNASGMALNALMADYEREEGLRRDNIRQQYAMQSAGHELNLSALKDIMSTSASANVVDFALALYVRDSKDSPAVQSEFLENLAKNGAPAIRDRILLEISKNALKTRDYKTAQECARRILDDYPASPHKQYALRILAWIAFNGETARCSRPTATF